MADHVRLLAVINSRIKKLGSFEDYIASFARKARELGWELGFIFPGIDAEELVHRIKSENAAILTANAVWNTRQGKSELIQQIRNFKPTIVDFHFCDTLSFFPVFLACRQSGITVVYHYHGEIRPLESLRWRNHHFSALRLLSLTWNKVITVSHANKRFLEALHVGKPIDVVYNGINVAAFLEQSAAMDHVRVARPEGGTVNCLYIGSLIDRKKVDVLLRAFAIAHDQFPSARLVVVGGGALDASCRRLATQLQLDDVVHFTGLMVHYPFELLSSSDILVSASESESFGLVFTEAMSFALPIVACRVGGIPEVIADEETGLLVEANNPEAFAAALLRLLQNPKMRTTMAEAGRARVQTKFQLQDTIDATFESLARLN